MQSGFEYEILLSIRDTEGNESDQDLVAGRGEDNKIHDEQLHHHGCTADNGRINVADRIGDLQQGISAQGGVLIVQAAHNGNDKSDDETHDECHYSDLQGHADAL